MPFLLTTVLNMKILKAINEYINKPFPFIESKKHRLFASVLFSVFIYLFLIVFRPFNISSIQYYKPILILGFPIITFVVLLFSFFILPVVFKNFFSFDRWTIKKNGVFIILQFLFVSILNWMYNSIIGNGTIEQHGFVFFILITISVGIFPTFLLIYFIEKTLSFKNEKTANFFTQKNKNSEKQRNSVSVSFVSKNNNETINIKLEQLLCLKSEGNYLKVFFTEENKTVSKIIRNSMAKIEEQLNRFDNIKRCHRSYLVNFDNINKITGNARSFNLHITNLEFSVPVSRGFPKEELEI